MEDDATPTGLPATYNSASRQATAVGSKQDSANVPEIQILIEQVADGH